MQRATRANTRFALIMTKMINAMVRHMIEDARENSATLRRWNGLAYSMHFWHKLCIELLNELMGRVHQQQQQQTPAQELRSFFVRHIAPLLPHHPLQEDDQTVLSAIRFSLDYLAVELKVALDVHVIHIFRQYLRRFAELCILDEHEMTRQ